MSLYVAIWTAKVQRMMHSYSLEESAAVERIKETDKQRKKYYSYYTGGDWEAASNYDLCLNTGDMSIEEAAEQILFYLKQKNIFKTKKLLHLQELYHAEEGT